MATPAIPATPATVAPPATGFTAPVLSAEVPEPTSYSGTNLIELRIPPEWIKVPPLESIYHPTATLQEITDAMNLGFVNSKLFPFVQLPPGITLTASAAPDGPPPHGDRTNVWSNVPISATLADLTARAVFDGLTMSPPQFLQIFTDQFGLLDVRWVVPQPQQPRILLVEEYRLSSFLGAYGPGRTLSTFSLLPGETTKIAMRTFSKESTDSKNASSILDSFTQESAQDFQTSVQREQSSKRADTENFSYHVDAEAKGNWGFASVDVKAGVKGGTNSARDEFAKNLSTAVEKHAAKASAKRDIQINTTTTTTTQTSDETAIERQIQNINVSRTLNFVFRQMNQEYSTLLHLVDARVAYFDGYAETKREVALFQLDSLIEQFVRSDVIATDFPGSPDAQTAVRQIVTEELRNVFDYNDVRHTDFVVQHELLGDSGEVAQSYLQVDRSHTSGYADGATTIKVPGVIVDAKKHVLRTEGVIVDALLGEGDGLDAYSHGLQDETVRAKVLANHQAEALLAREALAQQLVAHSTTDAAALFAEVFPPPPPPAAKDSAAV